MHCCHRYYRREIAAYDIQTKRCDIYGQDGGHSERVMLLYDGLHYDAMALAGVLYPYRLYPNGCHRVQCVK